VAVSTISRDGATLDSFIGTVHLKVRSLDVRRVEATITWDDREEGVYERLQVSLRKINGPQAPRITRRLRLAVGDLLLTFDEGTGKIHAFKDPARR
jgi:hypothetical protein